MIFLTRSLILVHSFCRPVFQDRNSSPIITSQNFPSSTPRINPFFSRSSPTSSPFQTTQFDTSVNTHTNPQSHLITQKPRQPKHFRNTNNNSGGSSAFARTTNTEIEQAFGFTWLRNCRSMGYASDPAGACRTFYKCTAMYAYR